MAHAAVETAVLNVKINATTVKNQQLVNQWLLEVATLSQETANLVETIKKTAADRGGFA